MGDLMARGIAGVTLTPLREIAGPMGGVLHALKKSAPGFAGFGEAYFSEINEGAIKSWRRHARYTLNLMVPIGGVRFIVHDDRSASPTRGVFASHRVGRATGNYARLTVAPGLWLAFQGLGPGTSLILDITDGEYDPAESEACDLSAFAFDWSRP